MEATLPPMLPDAEAHASLPASLMLACIRRRETTRLAILRKSDISGQAIRQRENINRINIALILTWQWVGRSPALPVSVVRVCLTETRHESRRWLPAERQSWRVLLTCSIYSSMELLAWPRAR